MKTLLLLSVLGITGPAFADQAADSFATGFANGFSQARYGQQYTANVQQVNVTQRQVIIPQNTPHYDALYNDGTAALMNFPTYQACRRYIKNTTNLIDCVSIGN